MASVKVAVRVRPFNRREVDLDSRLIVSVRDNQVLLEPATSGASRHPATSTPIAAHRHPHKFSFDYAYWSHDADDPHFAKQAQVYSDLGTDVVENAFAGYNACVFAYGQTGSGKTFTMTGGEGEERGLIPRICETMFEKMKEGKEEGTTYRTEVSYLEIYNERVKDLLVRQRDNSTHNLRVREHPQLGPYVENLTKHLVMDYSEIMTLMREGNKIRTTAATNMNDTSSRSHAIFTITFVNAAGFSQEGLPHETVSKIHLVDLAGSERADASGATGQRLKEGAHINKSLVTLGSVISALADASSTSSLPSAKAAGSVRSVFIPYRDSVLTWLLKDSLGGNSKTIMIATISPAEVNHSETLSTLRYANRAKNIINKPHVNEDPNVRLIRDLREEIARLRSLMSLDSGHQQAVQQQLAAKEAQERHLTEEWTEKWREAANILKEQEALALKRTGLGVMLDSDKPHLVGIDEDVLSTGITLYHLRDGDTVIGGGGGAGGEPDIVLKGPAIEKVHCRIHLSEDVVTLIPESGALCMVNASLVNEPTRLSQGCVVILGKTNMFRYNDPKEAENLRRMNKVASTAEAHGEENGQQQQPRRSLLSQSWSDLRNMGSVLKDKKLHGSEGDVKFQVASPEGSLTEISEKASEEEEDRTNVMMISSTTTSEIESCYGDNSNLSVGATVAIDNNLGAVAAAAVAAAAAKSCDNHSEKGSSQRMNQLYSSICQQKNVIMQCLESEQCDITTLNKEIAVLQDMQDQYSKLEYETTRNLWLDSVAGSSTKASNINNMDDTDFDEQFSALVEQEVDRRIFQEKVLRAESEFHEREMLRMQKEQELAEIRRQHEKEIYILKRKLHEASHRDAAQSQRQQQEQHVTVTIPKFHWSFGGGANGNSGHHVKYEVCVVARDVRWTVLRRFRQFRDLHLAATAALPPSATSGLPDFPSRRLFGSTSEQVSQERRCQLQTYLNALLRSCATAPETPLFRTPTRDALVAFSGFFEPGIDSD